MTTLQKIDSILSSKKRDVVVIKSEPPANLAYYIDCNLDPKLQAKAKRQFREFSSLWKSTMGAVSKRLGKPSHVEREYSNAPSWAPMGLYADWEVGPAETVCLFMGGDGNPEDDLVLLQGRTSKKAKSSDSDPWKWKWHSQLESTGDDA